MGPVTVLRIVSSRPAEAHPTTAYDTARLTRARARKDDTAADLSRDLARARGKDGPDDRQAVA